MFIKILIVFGNVYIFLNTQGEKNDDKTLTRKKMFDLPKTLIFSGRYMYASYIFKASCWRNEGKTKENNASISGKIMWMPSKNNF